MSKWNTLKHNGILFTELYTPVPEDVKILYDGEPITLANDFDNKFRVSAEEAAYFFARRLEQDERNSNSHRPGAYDDKIFLKNFWKDWRKILGKDSEIKDFNLVDFAPFVEYIKKLIVKKNEEKNFMSKGEKLLLAQKKQENIDKYGTAELDGKKFPIGNNRVQPPALYIGHSGHPLTGSIKGRIIPEDVTLNLSKDAKVPEAVNPISGKKDKWGRIVHNKKVEWLATYLNPVTKEATYVTLKRDISPFVTGHDKEKFEKARSLKENIVSIRKKYMSDLKSKSSVTRDLATAVYFLDILAIRPGVDKDEKKEAGTLGLTTLRCENVTLKSGNKIDLNFLGKSSIEFKKTLELDPLVYKNLEASCESAGKKTKIFKGINAGTLNKYLKTLLPSLSAKVFRTWKASSIMQETLDKYIVKENSDLSKKKIAYTKANLEVALALNHKRMTDNDKKVAKIRDKIKTLQSEKKSATTDKKKVSLGKRIEVEKNKLVQEENNVALGTSVANYLDPRIVVSWAKKTDTPIERLYNAGQRTKFIWSMDTLSTWTF